ncbi:MAG TPA: hypothetical protein DDW37_05355 [Verrucomicrobiales bacterium]|nr:hypothetical protein [Verrucomicrobiales bacterium]
MKSWFTVLKIALLAVFLLGVTLGYLFFRVWQKNERPKVVSSSWTKTEILLGHASTLTLEIETPWHRKVIPFPQSHPESLVPVLDQAELVEGSLNPLGTKNWTIRIPFVATNTTDLQSATASFPLKKTKRISPTTINLNLPPLRIITPEKIPENPRIPEGFLTEQEPKKILLEEPGPPENHINRWIWALGIFALIILVVYLLKRSGIIKTTPPWEKALANLSKLDPQDSPVSFYSKLTDILKKYTSERFSFRGRSKTSAEFLQILKNHSLIPNQHLGQLESFAHLSDQVKFADHIPDSEKAPESLELIKTFVNDTTPSLENSKTED